MHPELITFPFGFSIKTYGFCMMVGFLSAVWFAMRRAVRVKADPDIMLNLALVGLLGGVAGARLFFVVHYWQTEFADQPNRLKAIIDITSGGLEFLGAFLGASAGFAIYLAIKKQSMRLFFDIGAPGLMWGLALGRVGCFFNGCCFGGVCAVDGDGLEPATPWAMRFPYYSPAHVRQWQDREVTLPAELLVTGPGQILPQPLPNAPPHDALTMSVERRERPIRAYERVQRDYAEAMARDPDSDETKSLAKKLEAAKQRKIRHERENHLLLLAAAQRYPSRAKPDRPTSVSELAALAEANASLPVHPTQLYSAVNALLLSLVLSAVFYQRKRHGVVLGVMMLLYPISRFLLELIRTDNPHDSVGLTVSQFTSVLIFVTGVVYMVVLYKFLPLHSPRAVACVPADTDDARRRGAKR